MRAQLIPVVIALLLTGGCLKGRRSPESPAVPAGYGAPQTTWPGKQPDGSVLLHNQWTIRPAGKQVELGDFPVNVAVHPGGRYAAVLHAGYGRHQVQIVDLQESRVVQTRPVRETFYGLSFAKRGRVLYCSGAGDEVVHRFEFSEGGTLEREEQIALRDPSQRAVVSGLTVDHEGQTLYVANLWGHRVTRLDLGNTAQPTDFLLGTNAALLVGAPVQPPLDFDSASITKRDQATLFPSSPADSFPYTCVLDEKRQRLYVSLWAQASIAVLNPQTGQVTAVWRTEDHPCEMALTRSGKHLFVANANRNTVTVFDADSGQAIETISSALYPKALPGSTPNSLVLSPDEKTLYIANADNNTVAVFDVTRPGRSRSLGFIPVGWYPTSVRVTPDGARLLVANGRGLTPRANPQGPQPGVKRPPNTTVEYIGGLYQGSLSIIDIGERKEFARTLRRYTAEAYRSSPLKADSSVPYSRPKNSPVPQRPGEPTPIKYCLYIVKENRTYDQVLGDMPDGRGDPKLCLFPERVTPNHHKLAREFILLDNFYVNSEVSADGHEWTMGAYATDFVKKSWPLSYGHNRSGKYPYPSEGNFPIASPSGGYLWDRARQAGVTYRSYGEFVANGRTPDAPGRAKVKSLEGHFDPMYRSFDMNYPDVKRAERYLEELKRFERDGDMPRLQIIRLPNDHTSGAAVGTPTPTAHVADNDLALGMIVEAVTHSRFWPETAIFVLEDDAQNGPDHIDAHRSVAYVISPYTRRGAVDSTMYSTTSMLRTIELILGLEPMSQHDAAARPMYNAFQTEADARPYKALPANVDLDERNARTAWGSQYEMNLAVEDAADDLLLNEVVWRSVKGAHSPMPPPVRAAFVMAHEDDDDD